MNNKNKMESQNSNPEEKTNQAQTESADKTVNPVEVKNSDQSETTEISENSDQIQNNEQKSQSSVPQFDESKWDKQKITLNKSFYKTFSPRVLNTPVSVAIDAERAKNAAKKKGYKVPENPMILGKSAKFMGEIMIEVEEADPKDKNVLKFENKEFFSMISKNPWNQSKKDNEELVKEMGKNPIQVYTIYTSVKANTPRVFLAE